MKYIILILLFTPSLFAKCLIINESKIEQVKGFTPKGILDNCPMDNVGKPVRNIEDISYQKSQVTACSSETDCYTKLEGLCKDEFNDYGRGLVAQDFSEVYCVKPVFSPSKRNSRQNAEAAQEAQAQAKQLSRKNRLNTIKAQCKTASGLLKLMCEHITGE